MRLNHQFRGSSREHGPDTGHKGLMPGVSSCCAAGSGRSTSVPWILRSVAKVPGGLLKVASAKGPDSPRPAPLWKLLLK
eukprot:COSAG02_NODE_696_length_18385_cov_48.260855_16_plen_79_part_00